MKNMIKKNQMMITALAIMIAVAGYLNFAGTKVTDEDLMSVSGEMGATGLTQEDAEEEGTEDGADAGESYAGSGADRLR